MAFPYPIATSIRHATTSKSPRESHNLAFSAWEASLRFAVAAQNAGDVLRSPHPTVADWIAALPPELKNDVQINVPALMSVNRLFCETSGENAADTSVTAKHLFSLIPPYRDRVTGSDSTQTPEFFTAATPVLAAGLDAAWEANIFGSADSQLVYVEKVEHDPAGERLGRVVLLIGETPEIESPYVGTKGIPNELEPGRLYLRTSRFIPGCYFGTRGKMNGCFSSTG